MPYQTDPMMATKPMPIMQQTPGGLAGNINTNRYAVPTSAGMQGGSSSGGYSAGVGGGISPSNNPNATLWNTDYGRVDTGQDSFRNFADSAYNQGLSRLQPQIDQSNRALQQQLVARGLEPGTAAYQAAMSQQGRTNNDMLNSLNANAMQQGLAAQNQYFGQEMANNQFGLQQANQNYGQQFGYDQLANALRQSQIGASATLGAAAASAGASRYAADQQNYRADLSHQLGMNQLNENSRQFDVNDIYRTQGQEQNFMLGLGNLYNQFNNTNTNNFLAQQQANNNWMNQGNSMLGQAPGAQFTPIGGTASNMMNLGQAQANANAGMWGNITQGIGAIVQAAPWSDIRLKKNIKYVGKENGLDMFEYDYIDDSFGKGRRKGVMAHLVKKLYPDAVIKTIKGYMVDYSKLPVDMEVLDAV